MRLSDYEGEDALELLADLLDPVAEIFGDPEVVKPIRAGKTLAGVQAAIKGHKQAVITMLALIDGEDPRAYRITFFSLPRKLLDILNDPEVQNLFQWQGQTTEEASSGSATVNTEGQDE